ncbi:MAG: sulfite exporter TauE/SafE family protein, partial [Myxococcota bacterium]
ALRALPPIALGAAIGAAFISQVADAVFERLFGAMMLVLLVPMLLRRPAPRASSGPLRWSPLTSGAVFFGIGLYAGALQAGVGIPLLFALNHAGLDLVRANAVKLVLILAVALVAVPIFALNGQIAWLPAAALSCGFFVGAAVGARLAVRGGERVIRPVLAVAVIAMAGRMFGFY